jgi:Mg2+-importing ATPase
MNHANAAGPAYWSQAPTQLFAELDASAQGLVSEAARDRLQRFGRNVLREQGMLSWPRMLLGQFRSPLVLILVVAAVISLLVQDWLDAVIILAIVLGSALLGFMQEYRASSAVQRLRARVAIQVTALRDGQPCAVPAAEIVPGDVVLLAAGSLIPGDGVVLEAKDCFVNQALLTGESLPVEKQPGTSAPQAVVSARRNCVFMGTSVRSGTARILIVGTGARTALGEIAHKLVQRPPETDFERGLRQFGYLLTRVAVLLVLAVFVIHVFFHRPTVESLLFAIALAVGLSPELLPAILTITLARGARDMAARGVIVRRLSAIESLGSMDVLCTDKTGTLTEGVVRVEQAVDPHGRETPAVLRDAVINARLQTGLANPLDEAILAAGEAHRIDSAGCQKVDEIPYDFTRKRLSVVVREPGMESAPRLITKGAVREVLAVCETMASDAGAKPLDAARRAQLEASFRAWSEQGYRVLAVATKTLPEKAAYTHADEAALQFSGFLLCMDPPDPDAARLLAELAQLGVEVKIITGDNRYIAAHVAQSVGLDGHALLTGDRLDALREESLWHAVRSTRVFAEVDPGQKERIIQALRHTGHVVGFLGDGINDAPALHIADVGISVERAVDVAKEAADLVLVAHDMEVLRDGIVDGRRTFANTIKYLYITTSANFGNMVSMALASLFLPFLPLLAKQILLNNFLSDIPSVFIARDRVDPAWVRKPYHWNITEIRNFMVIFGLTSSLFDFITFALLLALVGGDAAQFRTGWFVESLLTELLVLFVIRTYKPFWRSRPGRLLWQSTLAVVALTLALPYLPFVALFDFVPLPAGVLAAVVAISLLYVAVTEMVKRRFYRKSMRVA